MKPLSSVSSIVSEPSGAASSAIAQPFFEPTSSARTVPSSSASDQFRAVNETVPAAQRHFALTRPVGGTVTCSVPMSLVFTSSSAGRSRNVRAFARAGFRAGAPSAPGRATSVTVNARASVRPGTFFAPTDATTW